MLVKTNEVPVGGAVRKRKVLAQRDALAAERMNAWGRYSRKANTCTDGILAAFARRQIKRDAPRFGDIETQTEQIPDLENRILRGTPDINHVHPPATLHLSLKLS
ncbi:hypothetical protein TNCV_3453041 [Trichonephila clavipes]|nr:hypothetical protein TNCV_3453041 [Trichonephila clavipes]